MNKKFYITTPIYYVNDVPHIGHTYTTVAADVLARYHRMIGDKTYFLTGTDEHGAKVAEKAKVAGKKPQVFTDEIAAKFQFAWDELNISNDNFIRTTDPKHKQAVQNALQYMYDKGDIYLGKYEALYCVGCEQYKGEKDLADGKCPEHGTVPEMMSEESYMFKLSKYADKLLKRIENDELKIRPENRKNEILSFYKNESLTDVSFSRKKVSWGIPLPWDESHTAYVWADAFLNYLTGIDWDGSGSQYPNIWPADVQLMSKDILRVHSTIWPAMLLSLDLPLPKQLFIHGYFLIDSQKMSKSIGNVIAPEELVKRYGVDASRYLLMSATTFGRDGDIGWSKFDEKYNADLANGLGNLVARSVTLVERMLEAGIKFPDCLKRTDKEEELNDWGGKKFDKSITEMWDNYNKYFKELSIDNALELVIEQQRYLDNYITENKPWDMIKNKDDKVAAIMYNILERLRLIAWMIWPFMPETAEKIWESIGLNPTDEMKLDFKDAIVWGRLEPSIKVKKSEALFLRLTK